MAMGQPNFKVALLSVNFDSSYTNVLHFTSRSQQQSYFNLPARFSNAPLANFNATSLLETSVNFNANPTDNLNTLCMQNYCIIQDLSGSEISYFFYFVRRARQLSGYNIQLDLELDIFQTYYIEAQFTDCLIDRTHLDRFKWETGVTGGKWIFDYSNTALLASEPITPGGKYISERKQLNFKYANDTNANDFINGVKQWAYIFVDLDSLKEGAPSAVQNWGGKPTHTTLVRSSTAASGIGLPFAVFVAPIEELTSKLSFSNFDLSTHTDVTAKALSVFLELAAPYVYSFKISALAPFRASSGDQWTQEGDGYNLAQNTENAAACQFRLTIPSKSDVSDGTGILMIDRLVIADAAVSTFILAQDMGFQFAFNASEIIGAEKDVKFNPKIYSSDYTEFYITDGKNNKFLYDIQKTNYFRVNASTNNSVQLYVMEPYTPDITTAYAYIFGGYYSFDANDSYIGLVATFDNTYPYATDQLTAYLSQNKNYYKQLESTINLQRLNMRASIVSGLIGTATDAGAGAVAAGSAETLAARNASVARTGIGAVGSLANTTLRAITSNAAIENQQAQAAWTLDNMRAAPDSLTGGNPFFTLLLENYKYTVEVWELFDSEKERVNDFMCQFGFAYGRVGNIKDFDHSRKYYNYIRAEVQEVSSTAYALSMAVHDRFQQAFAEGVRLWHWDGTSDGITYDYDLENYEVSLES